MCGIFCRYTKNAGENDFYKDEKLLKLLNSRGPDGQNSVQICFSEENAKLEMYGYTLWMQGNNPEPQPVTSDASCMLFNGDLFDTDWVDNLSDTKALFLKLNNVLLNSSEIETTNSIISIIQNLNGPFALIYLDRYHKKMYFCRDRIGRRSLLVYRNGNEFILSSVLNRKYKHAKELPANNIYCICLKTDTIKEFSYKNSLELHRLLIDDWYHSLTNDSAAINSVNIEKIHMEERDLINIQFFRNIHAKYKLPIEILGKILENNDIIEIIDLILEYLSKSVKTRVQTQPALCYNCIKLDIFSKLQIEKNICCKNHCTVGVLFSGGLDCTILAILAHKHLPLYESIDLLNVAFSKDGNFNTPDRMTSKQSYNELCQLFPERKWNLIEIDILMEELYEKQKEIIADLIFPLQTVLDDSLGSALWFAARGASTSYTSHCRILLTGIGADELFGGYIRHRNAYKHGNWNKLEEELQMDWKRIASRNLARDDRVISHHGRQPRMPFLDEKFSKYVLTLKPWQKCFPEFDIGLGEKIYLRLVAFKLGLKIASTFPKKAIQFGSRIANKKENAKDISERLVLFDDN